MYALKAEYLSGRDLDGLVVYATVKSHSWDVQHIVKIRKKEQETLLLAVNSVLYVEKIEGCIRPVVQYQETMDNMEAINSWKSTIAFFLTP